jgi:DNA-binding MarR family transcriptional regulator
MAQKKAKTQKKPTRTGARVARNGHDDIRLWLRLLYCSSHIESIMQSRIMGEFGISLARFDLMAQLERHPAGLKMNELSRRLMVSGGNVTGLTDQLVAEGLVERRAVPDDRRAFSVRLTAAGRRAFLGMAREHERWIVDLMDGLSSGERQRLYALLGRLKHAIASKEGA